MEKMGRNILIAVVVLAIVVIAGFFLIRSQSSQQTTANVAPTMAINETPTMAATQEPTSTPSQQNSVSIENFSFNPAEITTQAGTEVTWTNNDSVTHTVVSDSNDFDSGNIDPGATFKHTFESAGTFSYHCKIHPSMTGKVIVQ
jgi:plastocyanin